MDIKIKNKKVFLLSFFVGVILSAGVLFSFGVQNVYADNCSAKYSGSACIDTSKVTGVTGCVSNLCPGTPNAVKCCSISSVQCKDDGSSVLQPCSANGDYGMCNAAGACVSTNAGPIAASTGSTGQQANTSSRVCGPTEFCNPLNFTDVESFVGGILSAVQKIIVSLALVFIVIGAFLYITAGANPDNAENGKKAITAALVGLAIGIAAPSLLKELGNTIGWGGVNGSVVGNAPGLSEIAIRVLNFLLGTMGIVALIMLVIGAIMYLTSAGDEDRIDKGKEIFKYSLIGVLLAMSSMVLVTQIAKFFVTN